MTPSAPAPTDCIEIFKIVLEILKLIASFGAIGLVIAGWRVLSRDHNHRELRKETWARVVEIRTQINELADLRIEYAVEQDDGKRDLLAIRIKSRLKRLASEHKAMRHIHDEFLLMAEASAFRSALTGDDFESGKGTREVADAAATVRLAADELISAFYAAFASAFPIVSERSAADDLTF